MMELNLPNKLSETLSNFPIHFEMLTKASSLIRELKGVVGLCISGSVATNMVDEYSDLDLLIITSESKLDLYWSRREQFEQTIGEVSFRVDLPEVMATTCIAYYENHVKIHYTYLSESNLHFDPEYKLVIPIFILSNQVKKWLDDCNKNTFDVDSNILAKEDARFWFWFLQGSAKIPRGEFWAALDTLHIIRTIIVQFSEVINENYFQGYRRIEQRWTTHRIRNLTKTLSSLDFEQLSLAYINSYKVYIALRSQVEQKYKITWIVTTKSIEYISRSVNKWLKPWLKSGISL